MVIFHSYVKVPEGVYGDESKHVKTCQKPVPLVNKKNNWDLWMLIPPNNGQTMINMRLTHPWRFPDMGGIPGIPPNHPFYSRMFL